MDGVLLDTEPLHLLALKKVLSEYSVSITDEDLERYTGTTAKFFLNDLIRQYKLPLTYEEFHHAKRVVFIDLLNEVVPFEGIILLLNKLKEEDFKLAVASSQYKEMINILLSKLNMVDYFNEIVGGDEVSKGKPDPDIFLKAAAKLSINPNECIVIEDSITGVLAAKSVGMYCIAITNTFPKDKLLKADLIVDRAEEIKLNDFNKIQ